ncbi:MAG TPA: sigma-70 family RNA polymerase sigma factor [Puia sp.]|nr:sigma-70 family RNA polymerase sigma factor [Puia sp.]
MPSNNKIAGPITITNATMAVLFERFYPILCLMVRQMVPEIQAAEDIVVEAFSSLWEKRDDVRFINEAAVWTYLRTSTRNAGLNFLQKSQREKLRLKEFATLHIASDASEEWTLSAEKKALTLAAAFDTLHSAISTLPPKYRQAVELSLAGYTSVQIGSIMGIGDATVRHYQKNAVKLLRKAFQGELPLIIGILLSGMAQAESMTGHLHHIASIR